MLQILCWVTWPLRRDEAGGELDLIQPLCIYQVTGKKGEGGVGKNPRNRTRAAPCFPEASLVFLVSIIFPTCFRALFTCCGFTWLWTGLTFESDTSTHLTSSLKVSFIFSSKRRKRVKTNPNQESLYQSALIKFSGQWRKRCFNCQQHSALYSKEPNKLDPPHSNNVGSWGPFIWDTGRRLVGFGGRRTPKTKKAFERGWPEKNQRKERGVGGRKRWDKKMKIYLL